MKTQGSHRQPQASPAHDHELEAGHAHQHGTLPRQTDSGRPAQFGRYLFRHARGGPVGTNPTLRRRLPPRKPPAPSSQQSAGDGDDVSSVPDDPQARRELLGAGDEHSRQGNGFDHGGTGDSRVRRGQDEHSRRKALAHKRPAGMSAAATLARSGLPNAMALTGAPHARERTPEAALIALALALQDCAVAADIRTPPLPGARSAAPRQAWPDARGAAPRASHGAVPAGPPPVPATVRLAALQAQLSGDAGAQPPPATLADIKALLMGMAAPAEPPPTAEATSTDRTAEARANALLLLPIALLNATRPRTPEQRAQAIDRLQLLRELPGAR